MNFAIATKECDTAWVEDYLRFHKRRAGKWVHSDQLRAPSRMYEVKNRMRCDVSQTREVPRKCLHMVRRHPEGVA